MENQGYEEDQSRAARERSALESRRCDQLDDPVATWTATHPEGHVYEDIANGAGPETYEPSQRTSRPDEPPEAEDRGLDLARQAWINEPPSPTVDRLSQQSSTLSSSARISTNHDSVTTSSLAAPKTSEDENVSPPRTKDEDASPRRDAPVTSGDTPVQSNRRTNRRRRKKDCKHCRSKLADAGSCEKLDKLIGGKDEILRENGDASTLLFRDSLLRTQNIKIYPMVSRTSLRDIDAKRSSPTVFPASEYGVHMMANPARFLLNQESNKMLGQVVEGAESKMLGVSGNMTNMRINSIYSQDRWYGKESQIFYTDIKDQNPFQRAYSLPARTHTPTSQNRVNLRRSARNEPPPPHPARLDKHRRGWTLHLARPLKTSGCSSPLIPLLIVMLILLGVAGVALYIVFEPEKLQIIQQYLKSSRLTGQNVTSGEPITPTILHDESNLTIATANMTELTLMMTEPIVRDAFAMGTPLKDDPSFPGGTSSAGEGAETGAASRSVNNATRYCDDCIGGEVCVALVDEEVPTCRSPRERDDPTGCAGFCVVSKQKCHRLDVDAFRCVEIEHYCLDDEWTCSNTLCIPLEKHCDGHMNCYDHSDEYNCVCNLETHFQCGNETSCLPLQRRCDGKIDCWDATDEINCTLGRNLGWSCPLDSQFTCSNGECILKVRFCDGLADCSDGSDEPHGCQGRCNKHEFTCQNGRCITKGMKCNGIDDCGDGSDERHCKDRFT